MAWVESWWWLSPGVAWFVFFNVIVGAVAVLSQRQGGHAPPARLKKLTRSASSMVLERLRSLSVFSFHSTADYGGITAPASEVRHMRECYTSREEEAEESPAMSMLEEEWPVVAVGESRTTAMASPSAPGATAAGHAAASTTQTEAEAETGEEMRLSLDEAYAAAPRRRQALALQPSPAAAEALATAEMARKMEPAKAVKRRLYAEVEGKSEVNARADQFIRQFREDLKLERLNSILNHHSRAAPAR